MHGRCEDCKFWDNSTTHRDAPDDTGLCRQGAPTTNIYTGMAVWPFTEDVDWCGAFVPVADVADGENHG